MIATDRGLVLRSYKLRETSKIVSILGFGTGRVRLVAHGSRGASTRFGASLEAGNELEFVYSLAPGRELGTLREATLRHAWLAGGRRLDVLGTGLAALELVDRLVPEGAHESGLGEETAAALGALRASADRTAAVVVFYAFELRLLARLGLRPALERCAGCGEAAGEVAGGIDLGAGAFSCRACGVGSARLVVSAAAAHLLSALARLDWSDLGGLVTTPRVRRQVGICIHRLLATHLERYRYPQSLRLLQKVDVAVKLPPHADPASGFPTTP